MNIPLNHKSGFDVNKNQNYALQINWNLDRLFDIHATDGKFLVELRPAAQAFFIERASTALEYSGIVKQSDSTHLTYVPDLSTHAVATSLDTDTSKKAADMTSDIYIRGKANLLISNNTITLKTTDLRKFSKLEILYKGVILEKNDEGAKVIAARLNNADYMMQPKKGIIASLTSIENAPIRSVAEFSPPSNEPLLKGDTESTSNTPIHTFILEYSDEYHKSLINSNDGEKGIWVTIFAIDDIISNAKITYRLHNMPSDLADGTYKATGHYLSNCKTNSAGDCIDVQVTQVDQIPSASDHSRFWWDFNYTEESIKEWLPKSGLKDHQKQDLLEKNADSGFLVSYDGNAIIASGKAINMFDVKNEAYLSCCRTITFLTTQQPKGVPLFNIEKIDSATDEETKITPEQVTYIYDQPALSQWFKKLSKPIYLEALDFSGKLQEDKQCTFMIDSASIRILTDPTTRESFREKFRGGDYSAKQKGLSTAAFASAWGAIGAGALGAIAGVALLVKKLKSKKKSSYKQIGSPGLADASSIEFKTLRNSEENIPSNERTRLVNPSDTPDINSKNSYGSFFDRFRKGR